jgi:energy-converting hydrogenase Eha subunit E
MTTVALVQGIFYCLTGIWPLISMGTFEKITGPKTDDWLVKTVGVLVTIIGAGLILTFVRGEVAPEMVFVALTAAGGLALVDIIYVAKRVISPVYLLDAAAEFALILAWVFCLITKR